MYVPTTQVNGKLESLSIFDTLHALSFVEYAKSPPMAYGFFHRGRYYVKNLKDTHFQRSNQETLILLDFVQVPDCCECEACMCLDVAIPGHLLSSDASFAFNFPFFPLLVEEVSTLLREEYAPYIQFSSSQLLERVGSLPAAEPLYKIFCLSEIIEAYV
ncbi:hypothetical protein HHI36_015707 [Cryptolaemus montrouzieri]|uniref:Uncharacterized protein n=1 Tax=Cryptolaemus montrouzieri TaxID=559131 RepID=A0ABD2N777_9CUCU